MALFLQESHIQEAPAADSTFDMMNSFYEFAVEQATMTEAVLRADFIVDGQMRSLTEAGDEPAAKAKGEGFASKVWAMIKAACAKLKALLVRAYQWIKALVLKIAAKIKAAAIATKKFTVKYFHIAKAKAKTAVAWARFKLGQAIALMGGGIMAAGGGVVLAGAYVAGHGNEAVMAAREIYKQATATEAAIKDDGKEVDVTGAELQAIADENAKVVDAAQSESTKIEAQANAAKGSPEALKDAVSELSAVAPGVGGAMTAISAAVGSIGKGGPAAA